MEPKSSEIAISVVIGLGYIALMPVLVLDLAAAVGLPLGIGYWTCLGAVFVLQLVAGMVKDPRDRAREKYRAGDLYTMAGARVFMTAVAAVMIYWVL